MTVLTQTQQLTNVWGTAVVLPALITVEASSSVAVQVTITDAASAPGADAACHTLRLGPPDGGEGALLATLTGYAFFRSADDGVSISFTPI